MKKTQARILNGAFAGAVAIILSCSVGSAVADPYQTAVLNDSPVSFWELNETTGTIAHDSAGTANGTYTNALLNQPGYTAGSDPAALAATFGPSSGFSVNSYVSGMPLDFATSGNAVFSAEAWAIGGSQVAGAAIVGKGPGSGEEFYIDWGATSGALRFFVRNAAGTAVACNSTFFPDGNWHHIVGVCDEASSLLSLYVDGQLIKTAAVSGGIRTSTNPFMNIGSRQSGSTTYDDQFDGSIANVAIYNYALNLSQVQNHYLAAGIPPIITLNPTNFIETNEGSVVTIVAAAFGSLPISYQWMLNGTPIPGETNATFSTNSISSSYDSQTLFVTVSNAYGTASTTGTFLTVHGGPPQFVVNLQPAQLVLYTGNTFTYSVKVQNTAPFFYQWFENGMPLIGATNSSFVATATALTNTFTVAVSNNFNGGSTNISIPAQLSGIALPVNSYPAKITSDHPVAYWRLDDPLNSPTAAEYEGGHIGNYSQVQLGVPGYSPLFDTDTAGGFGSISLSDSYMAEADNSSGGIPLLDFAAPTGSNAEFSVEAWVNGPAGQNTGGSAIVAKGPNGADEFVLDASGAGGSFRFYIRKVVGGTSIINSSAFPDGNWHHLVGVCDEAAGTVTLYVDSVSVGQVNGQNAAGIFESTTPVSVGSQSTGGDYTLNFIGTIDDVSLYNYALTPAQVQAHYNAAPLPPYFTTQPATNIVAFLGQSVTLSAQVLGTPPMTNQWFSNGVALSGQTNISFAVNTSHSGTNTYTLKVSNAFGSVTNAGSVVQIAAGSGPPTLLSDITPVSSSRYATLPITFSVVASGSAPLHYQWFFNSVAINGATTNSYSIASLQSSNAGAYFVVVSNSISTVTSSTSTLTVVPAPTNVYPLTILKDHPVAYFRMDEPVGSSNGFDFVGGNVGQYFTITPANIPVLGVPGYDTNFDADTACLFGIGGTNANSSYLGNTISNIDFALPNGQSGSFSLEIWVNGTAGAFQAGGGALIAKGQGGDEQFAMDVNVGFRFYVRNAANATLVNAQASPTLAGALGAHGWVMDGNWHHVVGVCDQINSNLLLYVDGQLIGPNFITNGVVPPFVFALDTNHAANVTTTGTNGVIAAGAGIHETTVTTSNENTISIGDRNKNSGHTGNTAYDLPFEGMLDEVALYNYPLTPAQVFSHYAVGANLSSIPLTITELSSNKQMLTWLTAAGLQSSTNANGPWTNIVSASSPYTNTAGPTKQFFRLKVH